MPCEVTLSGFADGEYAILPAYNATHNTGALMASLSPFLYNSTGIPLYVSISLEVMEFLRKSAHPSFKNLE